MKKYIMILGILCFLVGCGKQSETDEVFVSTEPATTQVLSSIILEEPEPLNKTVDTEAITNGKYAELEILLEKISEATK